MIQGVIITPLRIIRDDRGCFMDFFSSDNQAFKHFGQVYFSCVYKGVVKGWRLHKKMTLNYAVPFGEIRLVLYDDREGSDTRGEVQEIILGEDNYALVTIPSNIWNGFQGLSVPYSLIADVTDMLYDKDEVVSLQHTDKSIPYIW